MGFEEVAALSNAYQPQSVQDSVSIWLSSEECGQFYNPRKATDLWAGPPSKYKDDTDQSSIASVDDDVSVSDSSQESTSSEASLQTSWTSATDPADISDEDVKEPFPRGKTSQWSQTPSELQDQLLKGLQTKGMHSSSSACPLEYAYRSLKARVSSHFRPEQGDRSQNAPQTYVSRDATSNGEGQQCRSRRSAGSLTRQCPPKLKRDTDVTEQFVSLLIVFATRLITAIWPLSACPPKMSSCFNGAGVLPLRVFIQETLRRSKTSYSTLQVALYYLILLKAKLPSGDSTKDQMRQANGETCERSQCRAMQCGRRMFLSALMLASKYLQDRNYSARAWSKISGLRSNEINENEREYLLQIEYNLHVPKESFDNWSKIVLVLSRLSSQERPPCRPSTSNSELCPPGSGSSNSLADMVSQVGLDEQPGQQINSDEWWNDLVQNLDPAVVKDSSRVDDFLRRNIPADKLDAMSMMNLSKPSSKPWDGVASRSDAGSQTYDMNFSDTIKPRSVETSKGSTPQTPAQLSPARSAVLPMQPQLRNLPTPQTTPRITEKCNWTGTATGSLRCSASLDALRSMRKQCFVNANLERCPPPRPQGCVLPPVKSLLRPAETIQELPSRSTTPTMLSPASSSSDSTPSTTRSRSSSISSNSSWSSFSSVMPQLRAKVGEFSSPLARVCSLSDRYCKSNSTDSQKSESKFHDEGYGSTTESLSTTFKHNLSSSSEVDAVHVLMSLSTHSETPSQSVTPTPQSCSGQGDVVMQQAHDSPRGHKRTLSRSEQSLETQIRKSVSLDISSSDADSLPSFYDTTPRQWQAPSQDWATPRRALPNCMDNKRLAAYCSIQQFSSAPDLKSQYLQDSMITAA